MTDGADGTDGAGMADGADGMVEPGIAGGVMPDLIGHLEDGDSRSSRE